MNWYINHRMEWIAETLRIFGFINREHIMRKFEVSMPQASADIQLFMRLHPEAELHYDLNQKKYIVRR